MSKMKKIGKYVHEAEPLGKGQYGCVYRCHKTGDPDTHYACKVIERSKLTDRLFSNLQNEIQILAKIKSKHVIKLIDLIKTQNRFYLITEFCNAGDLLSLRKARKRFNEKEARIILKQLVTGFQDIYKLGIMHRDLKLENILVHLPFQDLSFTEIADSKERKQMQIDGYRNINLFESQFQIKIADLGFAKELEYEDTAATICGTPLLMAPEVLNGIRYNHKADVWSLGVVFFELLTGFMPFSAKSRDELKMKINQGDFKFPKKIKLSIQGLHFLNSCLQFDSTQRLSWSDLVSHPYIAQDVEEEELLMSYSMETGHYIREQAQANSNELSLIRTDPHKYLNEENAIILNCRDMSNLDQLYQKNVAQYQWKIQEQLEEGMEVSGISFTSQKQVEESKSYHPSSQVSSAENKEEEKKNGSGEVFSTHQSPNQNIDIDEYKKKIQQEQELKQFKESMYTSPSHYIIDEVVKVKNSKSMYQENTSSAPNKQNSFKFQMGQEGAK